MLTETAAYLHKFSPCRLSMLFVIYTFYMFML